MCDGGVASHPYPFVLSSSAKRLDMTMAPEARHSDSVQVYPISGLVLQVRSAWAKRPPRYSYSLGDETSIDVPVSLLI